MISENSNSNPNANPHPNPNKRIPRTLGQGRAKRFLGKVCVAMPRIGVCGSDRYKKGRSEHAEGPAPIEDPYFIVHTKVK